MPYEGKETKESKCSRNMPDSRIVWMFPKIGVPRNGWFINFIMENPIEINDLGGPGPPYFWKHRYSFSSPYKRSCSSTHPTTPRNQGSIQEMNVAIPTSDVGLPDEKLEGNLDGDNFRVLMVVGKEVLP